VAATGAAVGRDLELVAVVSLDPRPEAALRRAFGLLTGDIGIVAPSAQNEACFHRPVALRVSG
jgi:hypothetical protein